MRVLTVPERLREEDRIQVETMLAVLAAGRRHIAPSRVQGLLLGLTEAELAAGVRNRGVQNLRRGQAPAPGPQGPTQHALAASTGVSDRTVRRLVRVGRDGSENLKRAVASGAISLKEADRRLAATKTDEPPAGPLILRALPKTAIAWGDPKRPESGSECSSDTVTDEPRAEVASAPRAVPAADPHAAGPPVLPGPAPLPPAVQAFLALCQDMEAATERFRRETARWTGERRAQRRLTIWQTIQHLNEQLEWMEATEGSRHGPTPS